MSDGSLSQDEIDALLQGTDSLAMDTAPQPSGDSLSESDLAALQTLFAAVADSQGLDLSTITGHQVGLTLGSIEVLNAGQIREQLAEEVVDIKVDLTEGIVGTHSYLLSADVAKNIAAMMSGQTGIELDDADLNAVGEAISQITGSALTVIGNQIGRSMRNDPPDYQKGARLEARLPEDESIVKVDYQMQVDDEAPETVTEVFSLSAAQEIAASASGSADIGLTSGGITDSLGDVAQPAAPSADDLGGALGGDMGGLFGGDDDVTQGLGQTVSVQAPRPAAPQPSVQPVQFADFQAASPPSQDQGNIGLLMDVDMEMTVELGRTKKSIKEILGIGEGTIIELDKLAGEAVDILVNHKPIAKGEVVVIDENFGVRVTEIISSPIERIS